MKGFKDWVLYVSAVRSRPNGRYLRKLQKRLTKRLKCIFNKQLNWILANIQEVSIWRNSLEKEIEFVLQEMPEKETLAKELYGQESYALHKGSKYSIKKHKLAKLGIKFEIKNSDALKFLGGKLSHELSNYKGTIHANTTDRISEILLAGAEKGKSSIEISKEIQAQGESGVFSVARGEHIAQREIGQAYAKGERIPINIFKAKNPDMLVRKRWNTVKDKDVRPTHTQNEEDRWIPTEQLHSGTGEDMAPSAEFRCRCVETYKIGK